MTNNKNFYITTAIDYTNAPPHIGHAYEKVCADVIARWNTILGKKVFFLTGTDEHGQKIERAAAKAGMKPKQFVNKISKKFEALCKTLNVSNDKFIRTTDPSHEKLAQKVFKEVFDKGEIYKGKYEGYYCTQCETFLTAKDLVDEKCQIHKIKAEWIVEESYFFKMSKYHQRIKNHIESNKEFIYPKHFREEILNRLKEPLKDLSVSRTLFNWGIPLPIDNKHVIYVWFDALLNYLSGGGKHWPADVQIIGPDILWFHTVIWPCILFAINKELPKKVVVHGFLTVDGEKMSKSLGNVIDPNVLIKKYGTDAVRYYLMRNIPFGQTGDFSEAGLKDRYNGELANKIGNLVSRVGGMIIKGDGKISKTNVDPALIEKLNFTLIEEYFKKLQLDRALGEIFNFAVACNEYIQDKEVWNLEGDERNKALYSLLDSIRVLSILLYPFIPESCEKINKEFGFPNPSIKNVKFGLTKSGKVKKPEILFKKIE